MSKRAKAKAVTPKRPAGTRTGQLSLFGGYAQERSAEAVQRDVMAAMTTGDYGTLPREITDGFTVERALKYVVLDGIAGPASFCSAPALSKPVTVGDLATCSMTEATFRRVVRQAMSAGFMAALVKYRKQLAGVPALAKFYQRQGDGQRCGRQTQSNRKEARSAEAIALAKSGRTIADIVSHFRANGMPTCQRSTVYRWLKPKPPRSRK